MEAAARWPALLDPASGAPCGIEALRPWAERLADLLSPALAQHLLAPLESRLGGWLIAPDRVTKARLYNRFVYESQIRTLRLMAGTGAPLLCLKGFASAHRYFPAPELRLIGDLDVLVRREDLAGIAKTLAEAGFKAMPIPSRFGFISDASFLPILSPDGHVAVDLHVEPDSAPATRALQADAVFKQAVPLQVAGLDLLAPSDAHAFFLVVSNIAKDRFGPEGLRKIVDAAAILGAARALELGEITRLARASGLSRALAAVAALLEGLGHPWPAAAGLVPALPWPARRELRKVLAQYRMAAIPALGYGAKLRRELLLGATPAGALRIGGKRLKGLIAPGTGLAPGIAMRGGGAAGRPRQAGKT